MPNILITGSNRGIGLEWVRQYAEENWKVFATCRYPSEAEALHALTKKYSNICIHRLDITKSDEINAFAVEMLNIPIDILVNNAGVYLEKYWDVNLMKRSINYEDWEYTFRVNTLGPVRITGALIDNIALSEKRLVVITSTHMASISDIAEPGAYYYRSTKAALNAAMEGIASELRRRDIGLLILHPGHVKTRMGGPGTDLLPKDSVRGMRKLIERFEMEYTGCFYKYDGTRMPW
jgi:NAD(P)-dependent dehydrogenase (short-subunit alcohol dehydrogenase family)